MIYQELRQRSPKRMSTVIARSITTALSVYVLAGMFGYLTFAKNPGGLETENILDAPYQGNKAISFALISQFVSIMTSIPLMVLP